MYDTDNRWILHSKQLLVQSHLNSVKATLNVVFTDFEHVTVFLAIYNVLQCLSQNDSNLQRQTKYFNGRNFPRKKFSGIKSICKISGFAGIYFCGRIFADSFKIQYSREFIFLDDEF